MINKLLIAKYIKTSSYVIEKKNTMTKGVLHVWTWMRNDAVFETYEYFIVKITLIIQMIKIIN